MDRDKGQRSAQQREPSGELLGPYALLTEIARGELTTVHLAKKHGALGFQRLMAVKRLKPLFARQESCTRMLVDEARLTAGLHHANLVGVLDVGSEAGCYVVSDYIEGENLEAVLARAGSERHPRYMVPVIVDALNGLHAAHTALDEDEVPLGIVHQAPRARHILVGVDGTGRITDFSQAKASQIAPSRVRSERLKVAYMAPEQALNPELVDHRADLFIMGVTLWEALTGECLFAADNDERSFQNLLHRRIPRPSEVGLKPPRCFDAVCMRALEREPSARYDSALDMARELRDAALNQALYATAGEIGRWVRSLMGSELLERRRKVGADSPSQELLLSSTRSSGYFEALKAEEDPYLNGRIHGGSFSMIKRDDGLPGDFDKTPALGMRGGRYSAPPGQRDEEPTAPHALVSHRMNDAPSEPPLRGRKSTLPFGSNSDASAAPASQAGSAIKARPEISADDPEHTQPGNFVPSRPGARRDSNVPSPGAYSQVSARRSRPSPLPPALEGAAAAGKITASFEELDTNQFASLPPAPAAQAAPARPLATPAAKARSSSPPPLPSRQAATEPRPGQISRQDSLPSRMALPEGPVGSPHGFTLSASMFPAELPKAAPVLENLPPSAPHRSVGVSLDGAVLADLPFAEAPNSLTPPTTAAQSVPPALLDERRGRSTGFWLVSGALTSIILLAAGVGVRQWMRGAGPAAPAAAAAPRGLAEDTLHLAPSPVVPPPQTAPTAVPSAAETKPESPSTTAAKAAAARALPAGAKPVAAAASVRARPGPAAPVRSPASVLTPVPAPTAENVGGPATLEAKPSKPRLKAPPRPVIPDNPY